MGKVDITFDRNMLKIEDIDALIEQIKSTLLQREEIILAYLFGSLAKGTSYPHSDVDIAILLDSTPDVSAKYPYGYRSEVITDLMKGLHTNSVDLVVLNDASPFLRFQVIRYGRLIFSRSEVKRVAFQVRTLTRYNDVKKLLEVQQKYLSIRLKNSSYGKI